MNSGSWSPATIAEALAGAGYVPDDGLATALFLAAELRQPLLLEGEPGVGKTAAALSLARIVGGPLLRLQCYEGLGVNEALYEWNYGRQLLAIRRAESSGTNLDDSDVFADDFLLARPLLAAVRHPGPEPAVLLIDEIDRADDPFEAMLFEFLGEKSVTVPEVGTFSAQVDPIVILTSNRTRELHDALKRRCFYHWIGFPTVERTAAIVRANTTSGSDSLVLSAATLVHRARALDLDKPPGVAEVIDWVGALAALGITELDRTAVLATLGSVAKGPDDLAVLGAAVTGGELDIEHD